VILSFLCSPFADPSHKLRASAQDRASTQDRALFCHSDPERSEGEESPQETLRLTPQGDRKGVIPSLCSEQGFGAGHPKKLLTFWGPRIKPLRMTG